MATYGSGLRRGLPRVAGGDSWPAVGDAPVTAVSAPAHPAPAADASAAAAQTTAPPVAAPTPAPAAAQAAPAAAAGSAPTALRRGLPRAAGADAWPPAEAVGPATAVSQASVGAASAAAEPAVFEHAPAAVEAVRLRRGLPREVGGEPWPAVEAAPAVAAAAPAVNDSHRAPAAPADSAAVEQVAAAAPTGAAASAATGEAYEDGPQLRRGLPRTPGGDGWPPAGARARRVVSAQPQAAVEAPAPAEPVSKPVAASEAAEAVPASRAAPAAPAAAAQPAAAKAAAAKPAAAKAEPVRPEPKRFGRFTLQQWIGAGAVGVVGLTALAAGVVLFVRWLLTTGPLMDFMAVYPGEYHLPEGAPVGFPGWLGWQHFFNAFLMILIIRSGLQVRREQRPPAYWTPRKNPSGKVSLTVWFHQSLDILWLVNGVVFIVLLFVTGQWMRVIPTSWEVFPNALSAMLQYISLDWPTDNGWVNYNGLQQLAYFTTIFIAAPLAAATGYRMSGMWPKNAKGLSKAYPVEWARALHFPVMLYFVVFILIHVILVFSTGALRNLNHMYAAQGSTDPTAYAENWLGFWMFVASLVVIAAAWVAARPMVLAPIARLFGNVSSR